MALGPDLLLLASKRAPVEYGRGPSGELVSHVAPGGTGSVVADQASYLNIGWIASAMSDEDRRIAREHPSGLELDLGSSRPITIRLLEHHPAVFEEVQRYFTADVMWATNNYLWDRWRAPSFDARTRRAWAHFETFTRDFANALLEASAEAVTPGYLLHDYQMVCVPELLRERRPNARILLFVHIPWPPADVWRVLPRYVRRPMLERMLAADTIAFFASQWARNFLDCVESLVADANVDRVASSVVRNGAAVAVRAMPLGYSPQALRRRQGKLPGELEAWIGDRTLVVHAGRTDPIKNAPRAVRAFTRAAAQGSPAASALLLVRMNPNRLYVAANGEYLDATRAAVADANAELGREAVRIAFDDDVELTLASFRRADVLFLNSTVDGQNLSAFEGAMVNERNVRLILSETCGAAEALAPAVALVNPFDLEEQADTLRQVLGQGADQQRMAARRLRELASGYTLERWVDAQLEALNAGRA